jgi:hypothetical protein
MRGSGAYLLGIVATVAALVFAIVMAVTGH